MRELSEQLYLTRREFLKAVGVSAVAFSTGCLGPVREFYLKKRDSDQDGLSDWDELNVYRTDPNRRDTDGDGVSDFDEVRRGSDPLKTPKQIKQREWTDRYNKAYGANLTLADLPLPAERAVHQLKMYENVDFVEPVVEGPEDFQIAMKEAIDLLKEKDYLDYIYVSKNSEGIKTWDRDYSGLEDKPKITIMIASGYVQRLKEYNACILVHEATHAEIPNLIDSEIIIRNPYEDPLGGLGSEILAYRAEAGCLRAIGFLKTDEDVKKYVEERLRTHR